MPSTRLTRRDFLRLAGMTTTSMVLAACGAPAAPANNQATPVAAPAAAPTAPAAAGGAVVTPQGRTLPADAAPLE